MTVFYLYKNYDFVTFIAYFKNLYIIMVMFKNDEIAW